MTTAGTSSSESRRSSAVTAPPIGRRLVVVVVTGAVGWVVAGVPGGVLGVLAGVVVVPVRSRWHRRHDHRCPDGEIAVVLEVAAREVRAGSPVPESLARAAGATGGVAEQTVLGALAVAMPSAYPAVKRGPTEPATGNGAGGNRTEAILAAVLALVLGTAGGGARGLEAGAALLRDRERARAEVEAGAAHARASAALLVAVPWLFALAATALSPGAAGGVAAHPTAVASVVAGVVSQALGSLWIARVVRSLAGVAQ